MVSVLHLNRESFGHKLVHIIGTFILIDFSWIFFRANRFKEALEIIKFMFSVKNIWILFDGSIYDLGLDARNFWLMIICIGVLVLADYLKHRGIIIREELCKQDYWFRCLSISFFLVFILIFGIWGPAYDATGFIYFQF